MKMILLFSMLLVPLIAYTSNIKFEGSAPIEVKVKETFDIQYRINVSDCQGFTLPKISDFNILKKPVRSTSCQYLYINGQNSQENYIIYTCSLVCEKEGVYTIPPATIMVEGKTYHSNEIEIKVIRGDSNQQLSTKRIEFKATVPARIIVNEEFRLQYHMNVSQCENFKLPELDDFEIIAGPITNTSNTVAHINGKNYNENKIIYTYYLKSKKCGSFVIAPAAMKANGRTYTSNNLVIKIVKE